MDTLQNLRLSIRALMRAPSFTALSLATLALGIGVTVTMFTVFNAVLLRPLPFDKPEQLVRIRGEALGLGLTGMSVSNPEYFRYRAEAKAFTDIGAFTTTGTTLREPDGQTPLSVIRATPSLPAIIGARPVLGRLFGDAEEREGANPVALISEELWKSRFGADRQIIGKSIILGETSTEVIGVLPAGLKFPPALNATVSDVWVPRVFTAQEREVWTDRSLGVIGRLRAGQTLENARVGLERVGAQIRAEQPQFFPERLQWKPVVATVEAEVVGGVQSMLMVMMGAVALVLLIACANVANLLLARASQRTREVAVRMALGGKRSQIMRQQLTESLVLGIGGGVVGIALAWAGVRLIAAIGSGPLPWLADASIDWRVIVFTVAAVLTTVAVFGVAPARFATDVSLGEAMKTGGKWSTATRKHRHARSGLVIAEMMIAVVLLTGAGLLVRSFAEVLRIGPGFDPQNVLTMRITAPQSRFTDSTAARAMYSELFNRLRATTGVQSVSAAHLLPLMGDNNDWGFGVDGQPVNPGDPPRSAQVRIVGPDYFETLRVPIVSGREIESTDGTNTSPVVVVNEAMAAQVWPGGNAIGQRISFEGPQSPNRTWRTVVGVVQNIRHDGIDKPVRSEFYVPLTQTPRSYRDMRLVVRTTVDADLILPAIRETVTAVDAAQPARALVAMTQIMSDSIATRRFLMIMLGVFSGVAFLLAAVGIYGVTAVIVEQRTSELGIRMALGAQRSAVVRMVIWQGTRLALAGIVAGVLMSLVMSRVIRSQLFGVTASDPVTLLSVCVGLCAAVVLACLVPAGRAARISPLAAIRNE